MNSITDVWNSVLDQLRQSVTEVAMNTWFADCEPVELRDGCLVICTPNDFKRNIIQERFADSIRGALRDLFSGSFDLQILTRDELDDLEAETPPETGDDLPLTAGYTFDRFVVGPSNKFAYSAAIAVSEKPGKAYNPLFIYGSSGLGKTHLLLSIGRAIRHNDPSAKIAYIKGDEFTNQMIASVREGTAEEFRTKYRGVDLFLMDDVQFIAGKQSTQEEFFHTYNNIYEAGHQIVITSDRPPIEMAKLDERLRTRFESGLMCDVQPPDLETRIAIIRNKASQLCISLSDEVVEYIAESLTANVRQIEGVVNRLTAYKDLLDDNITIESVKRAIKDVIRMGDFIPTPDVIIEETARFYSLTADELRGQSRSKNVAMARQISMYLIRTIITTLPLVEIGKEYEGRTHATVLSSIHKVESLLRSDPEMRAIVRDISSNINARS